MPDWVPYPKKKPRYRSNGALGKRGGINWNVRMISPQSMLLTVSTQVKRATLRQPKQNRLSAAKDGPVSQANAGGLLPDS